MTSKYEQLVIDAFARFKRRSRGIAIPVSQGSILDGEGIDVLVRIFNYAFWIPLQVKPSDTGETVALALPLPILIRPEIGAKLTNDMKAEIARHLAKHPYANFIIFVGRPNFRRGGAKPKTREAVMDDAWREIKKIFRETAITVSRKTLRKRAP